MPQRKMHASHAHRQAAYRKRCLEAQQRQLQEKGLPALPAIPTVPGTPRWRLAVAKATELLSMVAQEMEDYFADRSEVWHADGRGEQFQERMDAVEQAHEALVELATQ